MATQKTKARAATKKKPAARKTASDRARGKPKDVPCCCGPKVLLTGSTAIVAVALGNEMEEDELVQSRADANATVTTGTSADGSGGAQAATRLRKKVDGAAVTKSFRFRWAVDSRCRPLEVTVAVYGDVEARIDCAPEEDAIELAVSSYLEADAIRGDRKSATIEVTAYEVCTGLSDTCAMTLTA